MFIFSDWVDSILKAQGHRYLKRIPYMSGGKRRYRYIYKVTHTHRGRQAFDEAHLVAGTAFMLHPEKGAEFHGHITNVSGDQVTYRIDDGARKGEEVTVSKSELLAQLNEVHDIERGVSAERDKVRAQIEQARKTGSEKQVKRLEERLARLGGEQKRAESEIELEGIYAEVFEKHAVSPDIVALDRWYPRRPIVPDYPLYHQDSAMYERLKELEPRRAEACERYNRGLKRALTDIQKALNDYKAKEISLKREIESLRPTSAELDAEYALHQEFRKELQSAMSGLSAKHGLRWTNIAYQDLEREDPENAKRVRALFGDQAHLLDTPPHVFPVALLRKLRDESSLSYKGQTLGFSDRRARFSLLQAELVTLQNEQGTMGGLLKGLVFDGTDKTENTNIKIENKGVRPPERALAPHIINHFTRTVGAHYPSYEAGLSLVNINYNRATKEFRENCRTQRDLATATLNITKDTSPTVILHEIGHTLEYFAPSVVDAVTLSHATRVKVGKVSPVRGGRKYERAFDDDYYSHYTGKLYPTSPASEFVTTGVQEFVSASRALQLHDTDPHHFAVTYGILKGYFNDEN